jgi:glutamine synthetase type III
MHPDTPDIQQAPDANLAREVADAIRDWALEMGLHIYQKSGPNTASTWGNPDPHPNPSGLCPGAPHPFICNPLTHARPPRAKLYPLTGVPPHWRYHEALDC